MGTTRYTVKYAFTPEGGLLEGLDHRRQVFAQRTGAIRAYLDASPEGRSLHLRIEGRMLPYLIFDGPAGLTALLGDAPDVVKVSSYELPTFEGVRVRGGVRDREVD